MEPSKAVGKRFRPGNVCVWFSDVPVCTVVLFERHKHRGRGRKKILRWETKTFEMTSGTLKK